jgi:mRNA interferase MazF
MANASQFSQVPTPLGFGEAMVSEWQAAGLLKVSVLKPVTTIEQGLVLRTMGSLSTVDTRTLRDRLADVIA